MRRRGKQFAPLIRRFSSFFDPDSRRRAKTRSDCEVAT